MGEALDIGFDSEPDPRLRERLEQREECVEELEVEVDRLEQRLEESEGAVTVATDYEAFVEEDVVQGAIEEAKEKSAASQRYVSGVVAAIIQEGGPVDYATIAEYLGVSTTSNVSKATSTLEALGVVKKVEERPAKIDFDMESVAAIKEKLQRRRRAEDIMENL